MATRRYLKVTGESDVRVLAWSHDWDGCRRQFGRRDPHRSCAARRVRVHVRDAFAWGQALQQPRHNRSRMPAFPLDSARRAASGCPLFVTSLTWPRLTPISASER